MVTQARSRVTWDEFAPHTRAAVPVLVRLHGEPPVDLFVDAAGGRLGFRTAAPGAVLGSLPSSPFAALLVTLVKLEGGGHLEVSTSSRELYPYFFAFALSVADAVQLDGINPEAALNRSLRDWHALFEQVALLSPERQLGLLGELWLLDRLVTVNGLVGLEAWTGPLGEAHDFRIGRSEFEVKTTSGERRMHLISSDNQLVASPDHDLYLLSLQFASGGATGASLREVVEGLRARFASLNALPRFEDLLAPFFGRTLSELGHYNTKLELRSRPYLVPVSGSLPRLTRSDVMSLPYSDMARVSDVRYRLDVESLGWEDGKPEFLAVLPDIVP